MSSTERSPAVPGTLQVAIALALVYVVWGSTYLAIRLALQGGWPPLLMAGIRFLLAGALMYAFLRLRGMAAPTRRQWGYSAVMGVMLLGLGNGLVCIAEQTVPSGLAAVAIASVPLWIGLFSALRGERPTRIEGAGLVLGFAGVVWLNAGSAALTASVSAMVALIVGAVAWSWGSVWSRGKALAPPFMNAAMQMLCGGTALLAAAWLRGERLAAWPAASGLAALAYLVMFGSIVAFSAYVWLLPRVRPALAGSYAYVNPVIAVGLGVALAGERVDARELGAMAVILAGVMAINLARLARR
jgi:drug/metabolite transporter (DMT)-like permease